MERPGNGSKMSLILENDERIEHDFVSNERTQNASGNESQISMITKIGGVRKSPMKKVSKSEYHVKLTDRTSSKSLFSGNVTKGIRTGLAKTFSTGPGSSQSRLRPCETANLDSNMTNITPRSTRIPAQGLENASGNQIASLFQETSRFGHLEGHPDGKNLKKRNSPKKSCTTSYQKIDNVKYFRSPPTSSKPDLVIRNGCVLSINPRDNKHRSELELHPVFVQEPGARQERGGKEEMWETASIHRRITQDFMDTEDCQQDKSYTEVIPNYIYDNYDQNQSG